MVKGPDDYTLIYIDGEPVMVQGATISGAELRRLAAEVNAKKIQDNSP